MYEDIANLVTAVALILPAAIPIALTFKMRNVPIPALRKGIRTIQITTLLLGSFLLLHGLYHLSEYFGNDYFSDDVLEPASILILVVFALYVKRSVFVPRTKQERSASIKQPIFPAILIIPGFLLAFAGNLYETFSLFGILFSAGLFLWMAIKNPTFKALHFQFALITLVWAAAEVPHVLDTLGIISVNGIDSVAVWVHFLSMLLIGIFVSARSLKLAFPIKSKNSGSRTIMTVETKNSKKSQS